MQEEVPRGGDDFCYGDVCHTLQIVRATLAETTGRTGDGVVEVCIAGVADDVPRSAAAEDDDGRAIDRAREMGEKTFEADEGLGIGEESGGLAKGRFATKIGCARQCGVGRTTELNYVNFGTKLAGDLGHTAERPLFGLKRDAGGLHATLQNNLAGEEATGRKFGVGEVEIGSEGDRAPKASKAAHLGDEMVGGPEIAVRIVGWVSGVIGLNHTTAESA